MAALEEALKSDRAPTKVLQFNDFGLVAITRKRVKQSLERTLSVPCPTCQATGMVKSPATVCNEIWVELRKMRRHFENADDGFRLAAEVRRRVRWRPINLMEPPVGVGAFDVILFRYALSAFLESAQARILAHLAHALGPGGRLVLGRGERAPGLAAIAGAPCAFEAPARVAQAA